MFRGPKYQDPHRNGGWVEPREPRTHWPAGELFGAHFVLPHLLVDGERAPWAFLKNFNPLSVFGHNFWLFGPRARIDAPDM